VEELLLFLLKSLLEVEYFLQQEEMVRMRQDLVELLLLEGEISIYSLIMTNHSKGEEEVDYYSLLRDPICLLVQSM
jgi:hypothetical protein